MFDSQVRPGRPEGLWCKDRDTSLPCTLSDLACHCVFHSKSECCGFCSDGVFELLFLKSPFLESFDNSGLSLSDSARSLMSSHFPFSPVSPLRSVGVVPLGGAYCEASGWPLQ